MTVFFAEKQAENASNSVVWRRQNVESATTESTGAAVRLGEEYQTLNVSFDLKWCGGMMKCVCRGT